MIGGVVSTGVVLRCLEPYSSFWCWMYRMGGSVFLEVVLWSALLMLQLFVTS